MKRHLPLAALLVLAFATLCFAQPQASASPSPSPAAKPKPRMSKAALLKKLSANETKLWDGWKNKDAKPFQMLLASNGVMIGEEGIGTKDDVVKMMASMPCEVKSFTLSDWKLSMVNADAAVITYKGAADGTCGGQPIPTTWSSSLWVSRKGKWLAFSHQETPVKP
jgi:uncharacterized protein DUF4440